MTDPIDPPPVDELLYGLRDDPDTVRGWLEAYRRVEPERRTELLRTLRSTVDERPDAVASLVPDLLAFVTDEARSVRLTAAKLFVAIARERPDAALEAVDALAARLADDEEFYYVRARSAEALGYVALEYPDEIATPDLLADLRVGLSFDEPEVRTKLAKALAHVAFGDPDRLTHLISDLAEHLDAEDELVRYHLVTAVVAVGCENPGALGDAVDALSRRLDDDCPYVRGRAAEALGLLARSDSAPSTLPVERLATLADEDDEPFVTERVRFALEAGDESVTASVPDAVGALEAIREHTAEIVEEITTADNTVCRHCGLTLPETGPPMCPRCGSPY